MFETPSLPPVSVNDYRVLVDKSDLTARVPDRKRETTVRVADTFWYRVEPVSCPTLATRLPA